jgi:hypothetical protein
MGAVYSHALKVISWFGPNDNIAKYLLASFPERECDVEALQSLCDHVYWKRAWITQEFLLARRNTLMAGDAELNLSPAFWYALWANDPNVNSALNQQKQHLRKIERMVTDHQATCWIYSMRTETRIAPFPETASSLCWLFAATPQL